MGANKIAYICSPYAGEVEVNTHRARRYCRFAVDQGYVFWGGQKHHGTSQAQIKPLQASATIFDGQSKSP